MTRVAFLVCHLTGTGHLVRSLALARAVGDLGAEVRVISGGRALPHLDHSDVGFQQLPPLLVEGFDFANLRRADGGIAGKAYLDERSRLIGAALTTFEPDVFVTESFPLGRRRLAAEFERAIGVVRNGQGHKRVVCSVRDVPEPPSRPARVAEAAARIEALYDAVIVHGEEALLPLTSIWPLPDDAAHKIRHCGYIGRPDREGRRGEEVLVSVGGGALGRHLLAMAAKAAPMSARPWRLLVGGPDATDVTARLRATASANLIVEPPRPDYGDLLARAACSVSLAGYNTVMDLASCRTPAILVPFEEHGQREQAMRAKALADMPGITVLRALDLTPEMLHRAVEAAIAAPRRPPWPFVRNGAERAAKLLLQLARGEP
ncbi:MAG: glycosyltransferase [Pseudomonadota bacterium]